MQAVQMNNLKKHEIQNKYNSCVKSLQYPHHTSKSYSMQQLELTQYHITNNNKHSDVLHPQQWEREQIYQ